MLALLMHTALPLALGLELLHLMDRMLLPSCLLVSGVHLLLRLLACLPELLN